MGCLALGEIWGVGVQVSAAPHVASRSCGFGGLGFGVLVFGFWVQGLGFEVWCFVSGRFAKSFG